MMQATQYRKIADRLLPLVADTWPQLRRCDVFRLLESVDAEGRKAIRFAITTLRPDLDDECEDCLDELYQAELDAQSASTR